MATGVSKAATQSKILQSAIKGSVMTYFRLTYPWTNSYYDHFIRSFHDNPLKSVPLLYFYSHNDPMCHVPSIIELTKYQREQGYDVTVKDWRLSAHAQHYSKHPGEYRSTLVHFLMRVDPTNSLIPKSKL